MAFAPSLNQPTRAPILTRGSFVTKTITKGAPEATRGSQAFVLNPSATILLIFKGTIELTAKGNWEVGLVQYLVSSSVRIQYDQGGFIFASVGGYYLDTNDQQDDIWAPSDHERSVGSWPATTTISRPDFTLQLDDQPNVGLKNAWEIPTIGRRCQNLLGSCSDTLDDTDCAPDSLRWRVTESFLWLYHSIFLRALLVARFTPAGGRPERVYPLLMSDLYGFELLLRGSDPLDSDFVPKIKTTLPHRTFQPKDFAHLLPSLSLSPSDPFRANMVTGRAFAEGIAGYLANCNTYIGPFDPASMGIRNPESIKD